MHWHVVRSGPANADLAGILRWTAGRFGHAQARRYGSAIIATLKALRAGPDFPRARRRIDLGEQIWSVRLSDHSRARHVLYVTVDAQAPVPTVRVLRILHDSMDPALHLRADDPGPS